MGMLSRWLKRPLAAADASPMYADLRPYDERLRPPAPALPTPDHKAGFTASTKKLVGSLWERAKRAL